MKFFDKFNVSNESIDFQSSTFGKELEATIKSFKNDGVRAKDVQKSEQKKVMESIIFKHTGLKINLILNSDAIACVYLPTIHRNHLFLYNHFREYYDLGDSIEIFKKIKEIKERHTVNLKTAKVTGIFSELEVDIHLSLPILYADGYTSGEMTAILLHEIGHLFTLYEFISRQHSTNQVLAGVMRSVTNNDSIKEREFVFEQAGIILGGDKNTFKDLINEKDPRIISTVVYQKNIEFTKSELDSQAYDFTTCEQLADQFAARFGYGRELIEGLDRLSIQYQSQEKIRLGAFFSGFFQVVMAGGSLLFGLISFVINPLFAILCISLSLLIFFGAASARIDYTYDNLKTRYLRVREQFIQRLKDKSIDKTEVILILESIKKANVIINDTYSNRVLFDIICDYIFSNDKKVRQTVVLQRQLETLAMNDFFVKSAELSVINY